MKKELFTATYADVKTTQDGSSKYLKVDFRNEDGLKLTLNVNANDANNNLASKMVNENQQFEIEYNEANIVSGVYNGKNFKVVKVLSKEAAKLGFNIPSLSEKLASKM